MGFPDSFGHKLSTHRRCDDQWTQIGLGFRLGAAFLLTQQTPETEIHISWQLKQPKWWFQVSSLGQPKELVLHRWQLSFQLDHLASTMYIPRLQHGNWGTWMSLIFSGSSMKETCFIFHAKLATYYLEISADTVMIHRGPPMTTTRSMALLLRFRYKLQGLWPSRSSFQLMSLHVCWWVNHGGVGYKQNLWRSELRSAICYLAPHFFIFFAGIYFYYFCCLIATAAVATNGHSTLPWNGAALDLACSPLKSKLNFWNSEQKPSFVWKKWSRTLVKLEAALIPMRQRYIWIIIDLGWSGWTVTN